MAGVGLRGHGSSLGLLGACICVLLLSLSLEITPHISAAATFETLTLAAGCFWSVEMVYQRIPGVVSTRVGYAGGSLRGPRYTDVVSGTTGHAEAVEVTFDAELVQLNQLLDVFFEIHDPTTLNRQGNDQGTQYRSALFYTDQKQQSTMQEAANRHQKRLSKKIVTAITPLNNNFWAAEDNHQQFLQKAGQDASKGSMAPIQCYGNRGPIKQVRDKPAFLAATGTAQDQHKTAKSTAGIYVRHLKRDL